MQPETKFKRKVQADLKKLKNRWFFKSQEVSIKGIPDIILCLAGFFVSLELKRDKAARTEELQRFNCREITTRGKGIGLIVWPEIWEETLEMLKKIDAGEIPKRPKSQKITKS